VYSAAAGGIYRVTVGDASGSTGLYTAQLILNAVVESESHSGPSNNTRPTAQSLTGSSVGLGGGSDRLAVMGTFNGNDDLYSFHLDAGQSATLGLKLLTPPPTSIYTTRSDYGVGAGPLAVAYGDLNGDGSPDMVTADDYSNDATVRLNNGGGTFGAPSSVGYFSYVPSDVALGDVNNDGHLDIVLSNFYGSFSGGSITVMFGNGDGTFGGPIGSYLGDYTTGLALADFNGDGKLDVVQAASYANTVDIGYGDGTGSFHFGGSYSAGVLPWGVAVGDLNGDGHPDLVMANLGYYFGNVGNVTFCAGTIAFRTKVSRNTPPSGFTTNGLNASLNSLAKASQTARMSSWLRTKSSGDNVRFTWNWPP